MNTTMVQLKKSTVHTLKQLKRYERESYDELINSLIDRSFAEPLTQDERKDVEVALEDIKAGRVHRIEDVAKEFGVKLK